MNRKLLSALLAIVLAASSCSESTPLPPLEINGFQLSSEQPGDLASWYVSNLGFDPNGEETLSLSNESTHLTFVQAAAEAEEIPVGTRFPGFFKIGFKTSQLDALYAKLQANGNSFRGEIFYDNNLQTRSLVALDSDGNRVQLFEDKTASGLNPYFFSIMAYDFEQVKAWCESQFGFEEAYNLDLPDRGLSIRLMQKDGVLLELIGDERITQSSASATGIESIRFNHSGKANGEGMLVYNDNL